MPMRCRSGTQAFDLRSNQLHLEVRQSGSSLAFRGKAWLHIHQGPKWLAQELYQTALGITSLGHLYLYYRFILSYNDFSDQEHKPARKASAYRRVPDGNHQPDGIFIVDIACGSGQSPRYRLPCVAPSGC